jgi:hypothetical protein
MERESRDTTWRQKRGCQAGCEKVAREEAPRRSIPTIALRVCRIGSSSPANRDVIAIDAHARVPIPKTARFKVRLSKSCRFSVMILLTRKVTQGGCNCRGHGKLELEKMMRFEV